MMADGVHRDIQTTRQLLAQAVEHLDHITGVQQQLANVQGHPIHQFIVLPVAVKDQPGLDLRMFQGGHTYPYNPYFGAQAGAALYFLIP